ncbi:hypothetical protein ACFOWA_19910 [Pedobacter lithocola]|uniref:Helix-turn-helix domain-containing protein n=1 Tax=Pedobacter lithocola TaxID=1908239 RepID=A0ABV8PED8_9SPHI
MKDVNGNSDGDQFGKGKYNYNNQQAELVQVRAYLTEFNASATMVATALNIYRPNLTRYKHMLEDDGVLFVTHKAPCKETGRIVCYLSCNPELKKGEGDDRG